MQIRDMKTLAVDTIFPVVLIIAGLALATIAIFKEGVPRTMSPYIYIKDKDGDVTGQLNLLYNSNS